MNSSRYCFFFIQTGNHPSYIILSNSNILYIMNREKPTVHDVIKLNIFLSSRVLALKFVFNKLSYYNNILGIYSHGTSSSA